MMGCTATGYKTFLVCCNVGLLFVGLSVLILGLKMKWAMSVLLLINIPIVLKAIKAVIATGVFISLSGVSGICGACYESLWLLIVHLVSLGIIVIMEFSLGVTLMIVKRTIENALESTNCNNMCAAAVDAIILDYALPSAGLMMTIIFVEALMIYSSIRLFFYIRDRPKIGVAPTGPSVVVQNVQMQNVADPLPTYITGSQLTYPQMRYLSNHQPGYTPPHFLPEGRRYQLDESKPPDYNTLPHQPPVYTDSEAERTEEIATTDDTVPKEIDETFNAV